MPMLAIRDERYSVYWQSENAAKWSQGGDKDQTRLEAAGSFFAHSASKTTKVSILCATA
jgi:hypothetical protein